MKRILGLLFSLLLLLQTLDPSVYAAEETTGIVADSSLKALSSSESKDTPSDEVSEDQTEQDNSSNSNVTDSVYMPIPPVLPKEEEQKYIVRLSESGEQLDTQAKPLELEDAVKLPLVDRYSAELTPSDVNNLIREGTVEYVELDQPIELAANKVQEKDLQNEAQQVPWGLYSIGANLVKEKETSKKVKVAVLDTGISSHSDLNIKGGISFVEGEPDYNDQQGHGTHMAGTISAVDDTYGIVGVAPDVDLYAVKVISAEGKGYTSSVIQAIDWAIDQQMDIINISFTSVEYSESLQKAIQTAHDKGILIFAAAGNSGNGSDNVRYPAKYPGVIGVGAVNTAHMRATFSATGDGVDLVAPGTNVLSTLTHNKYGVLSGTSSATAFASGAAALLWEQHPDWTSQQVEDRMLETATSLGESTQYGKGLINIAKALGIIDGPIAPLTDGEDPSLITLPTEPVVTPPVPGDLELASYDIVGNNQTIKAGEAASVSLKLSGGLNHEDFHPRATVTVAPADDPNNVLNQYTKVFPDPKPDVDLVYEWKTTLDTVPGVYTIRYAYSGAFGDGKMDNFFKITVLPASGEVQDTYEPNNTFATAKVVQEGESYVSYIPTKDDVDYYTFTATSTRTAKIQLYSSRTASYSISAYNDAQDVLTSAESASGNSGELSLSIEKGKTYYLKIIGSNGYFGSDAYTLSIDGYVDSGLAPPTKLVTVAGYTDISMTWDEMPDATAYVIQVNGKTVATITDNLYTVEGLNSLTSYTLGVAAVYPTGTSKFTNTRDTTLISELIINVPQDSKLAAGKEQLFTFKPATTGVYYIYTGSYQNKGSKSFTDVKIFEDAAQSKLIAEGKDAIGTSFSAVKIPLAGGKTYYVRLSGFDHLAMQARITAKVISSDIPYIAQDEPKDIDESKDNSTVYIFVPGTTTNYKLLTSYYAGRPGKSNNTTIQVYKDAGLKSLITGGEADDSGINGFSSLAINLTKGVPYYVKVSAYNKVYARLLVNAAPNNYQELKSRQAVTTSIQADQTAYYSFKPTFDGRYRFFTRDNAWLGSNPYMSLYDDANLENAISINDDVEGKKPYERYDAKIEYTLQAGKTYYIAVKNKATGRSMTTTIQAEEAFQSTKATAQRLEWDDLYSKDTQNQLFNTSSLYDEDFYRISLSSYEQVNINIFDGMGSIEDANGHVYGYFNSSPGGERIFYLKAGEYYLRVGNYVSGLWEGASKSSQPYNYEMSLYISRMYFIEGDVNDESYTPSSEPQEPSNGRKKWDFTPSKDGQREPQSVFIYNNKNKYTTLEYRIIPYNDLGSMNFTLYKGAVNTKSDQPLVSLEWDGKVTMNADRFAWVYNGRNYVKNGTYRVVVYPYPPNGDKGKIDSHRIAHSEVTVVNRLKYGSELIPAPPITLNQNNPESPYITGENRKNCTDCIDYFNYYVYNAAAVGGKYTYVQLYNQWLDDTYGLSSREKFFKGMEELIMPDKNADAMTQIEQALELGGMIPFFGVAADGVNTGLYLTQEKYADAGLSALGIIPVYGDVLVGGKKGSKVIVESVKMAGYVEAKNLVSFSPCNCFAAGTLVHTNKGKVPIESLKLGDEVLSKNDITGEIAYKPVVDTFSKQTDKIYTIHAGDEQIKVTYNHPFWIKDQGWKSTEQLKIGDYLITDDNHPVMIKDIEISENEETVYNFTVAEFHTYFVTDLGIWTHNISCNIADYRRVVDRIYGKRWTKTKGSDSTILRTELKRAFIEVPEISGDMNWWSAHHIVPATGGKLAGQKLRAILAKYNIDVNSAANGVFLPSGKRGSNNIIEIDEVLDGDTLVGKKIANHNGYHYQEYFDYVLRKIEPLNNADDILDALHEIRVDLMKGNLVLKEPIKKK